MQSDQIQDGISDMTINGMSMNSFINRLTGMDIPFEESDTIETTLKLPNSGIVIDMKLERRVSDCVSFILYHADQLYAHELIELDRLPCFLPDNEGLKDSVSAVKTQLRRAIEIKNNQKLDLDSDTDKCHDGDEGLMKERKAGALNGADAPPQPNNIFADVHQGMLPDWLNILYKHPPRFIDESTVFCSSFRIFQYLHSQKASLKVEGSADDTKLFETESRSYLTNITNELIKIFSLSESSDVKSSVIYILDCMKNSELYSCDKKIVSWMETKGFIISLLSDSSLYENHNLLMISLMSKLLYDDVSTSFLPDLICKEFINCLYNIVLESGDYTRWIYLFHIVKAVSQSSEMLRYFQSLIGKDSMKKLSGGKVSNLGKEHLALLFIYGELLFTDPSITEKALEQNIFHPFVCLLIEPVKGIKKIMPESRMANETYATGQLNYIMMLPYLLRTWCEHPEVVKTMKNRGVISKMNKLYQHVKTHSNVFYRAISEDSVHKQMIEKKLFDEFNEKTLETMVEKLLLLSRMLIADEKSERSVSDPIAEPIVGSGGSSNSFKSTILNSENLAAIKNQIRQFLFTIERIHSDLVFETNQLSERDKNSGYQRGLRLSDDKFKEASVAHRVIAKNTHKSFDGILEAKILRKNDVKSVSKTMETERKGSVATFFSNTGAVIAKSKRDKRQHELKESENAVVSIFAKCS